MGDNASILKDAGRSALNTWWRTGGPVGRYTRFGSQCYLLLSNESIGFWWGKQRGDCARRGLNEIECSCRCYGKPHLCGTQVDTALTSPKEVRKHPKHPKKKPQVGDRKGSPK